MKLTYDPQANIAYIRLRKRRSKVQTIQVSDEVNIDLGADGSIYGIELLNANSQLSSDRKTIVVKNESSGESARIALAG
jgi:uncharacterized protein YuzE